MGKRSRPSGRGGKGSKKKKKKKGSSDWYTDGYEKNGAISDDDVEEIANKQTKNQDVEEDSNSSESDNETFDSKKRYNSLLSSLLSDPNSALQKEQKSLIHRVQMEQKGIEVLEQEEDSDSMSEESEDEDDESKPPVVEAEEEEDAEENEESTEEKDEMEEDDVEDEDDTTAFTKCYNFRFNNLQLTDGQVSSLKKTKGWKAEETQFKLVPPPLASENDSSIRYSTTLSYSNPDYLSNTMDMSRKNQMTKAVKEFPESWGFRPRLSKRWATISSQRSKKYPRYRRTRNDVGLSKLQEKLLPEIVNYKDIVFTDRQLWNAVEIREMYAIHLMNHVFMSRDRVVRHTQRLKQVSMAEHQMADAKRKARELTKNGNKKRAEEIISLAKQNHPKLAPVDEDAIRDQGFTRPRALVILPMRNQAAKLVKLLIDLMPEGSQIHNRGRFFDEFTDPELMEEGAKIKEKSALYNENDLLNGKSLLEYCGVQEEQPMDKKSKKRPLMNRPDDWRSNFEGNTDDCFRIGISFPNRKSMRLYSDFYQSDIIIASPLGLRLATNLAVGEDALNSSDEEDDEASESEEEEHEDKKINTEADFKENTKVKGIDIDFLSSIELLVIDQANFYHMQNWQHLVDVTVSAVNQQPQKMRDDTDFARIRESFLSGHGSYFRQTLIFAQHSDPFLNSLTTGKMALCRNVQGLLKIQRSKYKGSIMDVLSSIPQRFMRVDVPSEDVQTSGLAAFAEAQFEFFKSSVFPSLLGPAAAQTLVVIPTYFDYVRIRNMFNKKSKELESHEIDHVARMKRKRKKLKTRGKAIPASLKHIEDVTRLFCTCSEYSEPSDVTKARGEFFHGKARIMLTTERFYFFFRYRLRGVKRVVFYGPPSYPKYYSELLNLVETGSGKNTSSSLTLYTQADALALERLVGTNQSSKMLEAGPDDTTHVFSFAE